MIKKLLLSLFVFLLCLQVITDTDFGWHIRVGEYILQNKTVPKVDIFSFSNPDYPYVYHSWGSEVLLYLSFKTLGFYGATIFYTAILSICVYVLYKIVQLLNKEKTSTLFILTLAPLAYTVGGARTRVFSLLFSALLYYLFLKYKHHGSKLIFFTPAIFFLWVNLHASFVFGIFTLFILIATEYFFSNKKKATRIIFLIPASIAATLINPYFQNSWKQAISMLVNSYHIQSINPDWQPLINTNNSGWIFAAFTITILVAMKIFKIHLDKTEKAFLIIALTLSLISSRASVILLIFLVSPTNHIITFFKNKFKKEAVNALPVITSIAVFTLVLFLLMVKNIVEITTAYTSAQNYSKFIKTRAPKIQYAWPNNGSEYIQNNLKGKRILTEANWASYMLIYDKDLKLFYYSAMDNFIVNGHSFAFEYLQIIYALNDFEKKLEKYNVEVVFLPDDIPLAKSLINNPKWQTVFKDDYATVFVKN